MDWIQPDPCQPSQNHLDIQAETRITFVPPKTFQQETRQTCDFCFDCKFLGECPFEEADP